MITQSGGNRGQDGEQCHAPEDRAQGPQRQAEDQNTCKWVVLRGTHSLFISFTTFDILSTTESRGFKVLIFLSELPALTMM